MNIQKWKEEQENDMMFRQFGNSTEAMKLLEKSPTNRDITSEQGMLLSVARFFDRAVMNKYPVKNEKGQYLLSPASIYEPVCNYVEESQMSVDNQARKDYMKFGIEQWQGKLASAKKSAVEALL